MKKKPLAFILTAMTMLSACTSDKAVAENEEIFDDIDNEFAEEIFDDMPEISQTEDSETKLSEADNAEEIFDDTTIISETELSEENVTEEVTEIFDESEEEVRTDLMEFLPDKKLKNKTVKFLATYDPWGGEEQKYYYYYQNEAAKLFEEKYGGEIEWYPTTSKYQFSDLSVMILGGQGMDLFPAIDAVPKCVINGSFQSYDEYVDWESPIWSSVKPLNDPYVIGGKHYMMACYAEEEWVVFYNKSIVSENGYDDPWELYKNGKWTMSRFTSMLEDYVDEKNERYGLKGLFNVYPLTLVSGKTPVSIENGRFVNNLSDPNFDRAMNYQYELYRKGLMSDFISEVDAGTSQENYFADGKALFYISYSSEFSSMGDSSNVGVVPIPKDDKADKYYHNADIECYSLCKKADNPEGAVRLMECLIAAYNDESIKAGADELYRTEYGWTDEYLERINDIRRIARKYPVADIYTGLPDDAYSMVSEKVYSPLFNAELDSIKNHESYEMDMLIEELNAQLEIPQN